MPKGFYKHKRRHGMKGTRIYESWMHMKQRCLNKNCKDYKNYGGRGITVCEEWLEFENFYKDMGNVPENKTLDRINNNGNYCKKNCCWSTKKEQNNNKRCNRLIVYEGKTQNVSQWAEELGMSHNRLFGRLNMGWDIERAFINKQ